MMGHVGSGHHRIGDVLAAYVLGAMEPEECDEVESHVDRCACCRAQVDGLLNAVHVLRTSLPPCSEPLLAEPWSRIVARVGENGLRGEQPQLSRGSTPSVPPSGPPWPGPAPGSGRRP